MARAPLPLFAVLLFTFLFLGCAVPDPAPQNGAGGVSGTGSAPAPAQPGTLVQDAPAGERVSNDLPQALLPEDGVLPEENADANAPPARGTLDLNAQEAPLEGETVTEEDATTLGDTDLSVRQKITRQSTGDLAQKSVDEIAQSYDLSPSDFGTLEDEYLALISDLESKNVSIVVVDYGAPGEDATVRELATAYKQICEEIEFLKSIGAKSG